MDGKSCGAEQEKHNVVVTFQVLEHITNIDTFIESSIKVMKPNGLLIIAVPNNESFIKFCQNNLLNMPPHHLLHWNEKSLSYIAKKYNLEIVDIYKESLTNIHKKWHDTVLISKAIRNFFGLKTKSINVSFTQKIINKLAFLLSHKIKPSNSMNEDGATIAIVLKKT